MAERLPSPTKLRAQALYHREQALTAADAEQRRMRLAVAHEYEKLAVAIEAERELAQLGSDLVAP